jgi:putative oxygen-independent coproporphyrinogen III oxidase
VESARAVGFDRINLDLMFALPAQTLQQAISDLEHAIALGTEHLSYYQLTLEPNTPFHHRPPRLPADDMIWEMQQTGHAMLAAAGFDQYEISAFARPGGQCRHNLNYWRFGDYLGIGAGAHGKLTSADGNIHRRSKRRHPTDYMEGPALKGTRELQAEDRVIEFMLNALRLRHGVERALFPQATGLSLEIIAVAMQSALERGLMHADAERLCATPLGFRFLNNLLELFDGIGPSSQQSLLLKPN